MAQYVVTIPNWHPVTLNELVGFHWGKVCKKKNADKKMVQGYMMYYQVPEATGKRRVSILLRGWTDGQFMPDKDAFDKSLLDALVSCGRLIDDSADCLEGRMEVTLQRGGDWDTVITLEDV